MVSRGLGYVATLCVLLVGCGPIVSRWQVAEDVDPITDECIAEAQLNSRSEQSETMGTLRVAKAPEGLSVRLDLWDLVVHQDQVTMVMRFDANEPIGDIVPQVGEDNRSFTVPTSALQRVLDGMATSKKLVIRLTSSFYQKDLFFDVAWAGDAFDELRAACDGETVKR